MRLQSRELVLREDKAAALSLLPAVVYNMCTAYVYYMCTTYTCHGVHEYMDTWY